MSVVSPGTVYVGACIDAVFGESETGNNCSTAVRVVAEEPGPAPDLVAYSVTVSDATPGTGQRITLHAAVRNDGEVAATPTTMRFYRSTDSTISTSDVELARDPVAALGVSAAESRTFYGTASSTPGTFYFGVCINVVSAESDTGNNCSDGVLVTVEEGRQAAPDLIVSSFSVPDTTPPLNEQFDLGATVRNRGGGPATPATLRFYASDDVTISTSDREVIAGRRDVAALPASATESRTARTGFRSPRTVYFGACIDPVPGESDTGNNCSGGVLVVVEQQIHQSP